MRTLNLPRFAIPLLITVAVLAFAFVVGWRAPFFLWWVPLLFFWFIWRPWYPRDHHRAERLAEPTAKDVQIARLETQVAALTASQQRLQDSLDWQARLIEQSMVRRTRKKPASETEA